MSNHCTVCDTKLYWGEKHAGLCRLHDPDVVRTGTVPYPQFCSSPERCDGLGSCPRDYSCCE
jgi:hypothetical protein